MHFNGVRRDFSCLLLTFLVVGAILVAFDGTKFEAGALSPVVSILPSSIQTLPGQGVTVDVNITDVTDLYAYEFRILYPSSVVTCAEIVLPAEHLLEPLIDPNDYYVMLWEKNEPCNTTHRCVHVAYTLLDPEHGVTGSGILFRMSFTGGAIGPAPLIFIKSITLNTAASYIPHTTNNGLITTRHFPYFESLTRDAPFPEYDDTVNVTCHIDGVTPEEIATVVMLHSYNFSGSSGDITTTMTPLGNNIYADTIPAYPYQTVVTYSVQVLDTYGNRTASQESSYTVVDKAPPKIMSPVISPSKTIIVNATEECNASGIAALYLSLKDSNGNWWRTTMIANETGQWTALIPIAVSFTNPSAEYMVQADDCANNSATLSGSVQLQSWWFADVNSDGQIDIFDIVIVAIHMGQSG